ncbi:MAG TPA: hypothetical protein VK534_00255, partial [Methylomirabilota bacterium]|nr:hypothetical protein [Methylomirabilota bacterium]
MNLDYFKTWPRLKILTYLSFALLAVATVYSAWFANYYASSNSDNIVYPYLFQHFRFNDMILPGQHANILKFPLFILQSVLPYNFTTTTIVNLGLVLITTLGWTGLLVWLFGRRYAALICLALSSILVTSYTFNLDVLGGTIRNIEFPIVLAFIVCSGSLLRKAALPKSKRILSYVVGVLFAMTAAGDSFFLYTISVALLATLAYYWLTSGQKTKLRGQYWSALKYIGGFTILALLIRAFISIFGIANYYTAGVFKPHILTLQHLGPSISTAANQV